VWLSVYKRQFNQIVELNRIIFSPNRNALVIRDHTTQTSGLRRSRVKNGAVYGHTSSIVLHHIPTNWRRPAGRPRQTWLATITNDLDQLGISMDDVCEVWTGCWSRALAAADTRRYAWWWWWWWWKQGGSCRNVIFLFKTF